MHPTTEDAATVSGAVAVDQEVAKKRCLMLIADDSLTVQKAANLLASRLDIDLKMADNGQMACQLAEKSKAEGKPYDVILMDMQMPRMNGVAATKWLREHGWEGVIIAISVHVSDENRQEFLAAGSDAFIAKPINERKLRRVIEQPLKRRSFSSIAELEPSKVPLALEKDASYQGRLLIAEDARCIQMQLGSLLKKLNLEGDIAENGQIACEKAIQSMKDGKPYDVILMDMQMPKMNGRQAIQWLREHKWEGPIVAVSIRSSERDHEEYLNAGCDDYLAKPVNELSLRNVLSQFLNKA